MKAVLPVLMMMIVPGMAAAQQAGVSATSETSASAAVSTTRVTGDASADARIAQSIAGVEARGLSSASLESRVQLGRARGVAPSRIAASVEQRANAIVEASNALRASGQARASLAVELAADAIESGARASQVTEVALAFGDESRPRALSVLGTLAADGAIGANAVAAVQAGIERGIGANAVAGGALRAADVTAGGSAAAGAAVGSSAATVQGTASGVIGTARP